MATKSEPHFLIRIAAFHFPAFDHVDYVVDRFVGMGCGANKAIVMGTIADNDPVDQVFKFLAASVAILVQEWMDGKITV